LKPSVVLVETNWVVDVTAPAHLQSPQAIQLLLLSDLYDNSRVWVYGDFLLEEIDRLPMGWDNQI
jgi:sulfur relay (sulfurtransferase) DsrF/TusC family protein